jgi:Polyketide cyclase / dehydrase and lipid transport
VTRGRPWWTRGADCVLAEDVPAPPEAVRDFYVDLRNIMEVHPLVVSVRPSDRVRHRDGYVQSYRVRDRIRLGRLTVGVTYTATLTVTDAGDVLTEARQFPHVRLDGVVSFEPSAGGTRVTERLRVVAPAPLASVTVRQATAAHVEMLAGIRRRFAQPTGR